MSETHLLKASPPLHMQPADVRMSPMTQRLGPIQHIRDRTVKRQKQLLLRPVSLANFSGSSETVASLRKQSEPSYLRKDSRASSESVQVMLDCENSITPQIPFRDRSNEVFRELETPIDTPLSTGISFNFGASVISPRVTASRQSDGNPSVLFSHKAFHADRIRYQTEELKLQEGFQHGLAAIWIGEIVGHAITSYYQGKRGELIEDLTRATHTAQEYELYDLMGRSQLWKAIVFHDMGRIENIAHILGDVLSLVRNFGDAMDCYQLRKLLPVYGHAIFQHLMIQGGAKQETESASGFDSPATQGTFETWYKWQVSELEKKYDHQEWPDLSVVEHSARASSKSTKSNAASHSKPETEDVVASNKIALEDPVTSVTNATLLENLMQMEEKLLSEREEHENILKEMFEELNKYRAIVNQLQYGDPWWGNHHDTTAPDARSENAEASKASFAAISPGQITAVNEILKAARPRSHQQVQSRERVEALSNALSEERSYLPNAMQIERWREEHRKHSLSPASNKREMFSTPTHVEYVYNESKTDSMSSFAGFHMSLQSFSSVQPPQPLRIRNPDDTALPANFTQNPRNVARSRVSSRSKHTLDGRRTGSRSSRRRESRALVSANWRNLEGLLPPSYTSSAVPSYHEIQPVRGETLRHPQTSQSNTPQGSSTSMNRVRLQPAPKLDTSASLHIDAGHRNTDQSTCHGNQASSGPRLSARRSSLPSPSLISPLTIDPWTELPLTDTPSPTKLHYTMSAFRDCQEKRRRSTSVSVSPTSISYEKERRQSHALAAMKAREVREQRSETYSMSAQNGSGQALSSLSKDDPASVIDGATLSSSDNAASNRVFLSMSGIPVGHAAIITSMSTSVPALPQESRLIGPTPYLDKTTWLEIDQSHSEADVDAIALSRTHRTQGSVPATPSPLRETSGADDVGNMSKEIHKPKEQSSQMPQAEYGQAQPKSLRFPHAPSSEQLVSVDRTRQLSIRDFAYDSGSETSDLYGVSEASFGPHDSTKTSGSFLWSAATPKSSSKPKPVNKVPIVSTSGAIETLSPVRLSRLYEEIENSYPPNSPSATTALTGNSPTSDGRPSISEVPRLNLNRLQQQREQHQEQNHTQYEDDEAISPTAQPKERTKVNTSPQKNGKRDEAMRQAVLTTANQMDLEKDVQADWIANADTVMAEYQQDREEDLQYSEVELYGEVSDDATSSEDSVGVTRHRELTIPNAPPTTMEDFPVDDAEIEGVIKQPEERETDGALEVLLPMTYVPESTPGEDDRSDAQTQREDMEKVVWSDGVI